MALITLKNEEYNFFFRNQSTGNPTKAHITKGDDFKSTLCGWAGDVFTEEYDGRHWSAHELDVCKKCLKKYQNETR